MKLSVESIRDLPLTKSKPKRETAFIYYLADKDNIFYVGSTTKLNLRLNNHKKNGLDTSIHGVLDVVHVNYRYIREHFWIDYLESLGCKLQNKKRTTRYKQFVSYSETPAIEEFSSQLTDDYLVNLYQELSRLDLPNTLELHAIRQMLGLIRSILRNRARIL